MEYLKEQETEQQLEEPPGTEEPPGKRSALPPAQIAAAISPGANRRGDFAGESVSLEEWNDWRWQMRHALRTAEQLDRVIHLTPDEREAISAPGHLRVQVTPYLASLINPDDPGCPIRRQFIPTRAECAVCPDTMEDSLAEEEQSPVPGLVHRYPDRVLVLATTLCGSYCRYCTRSRLVGHGPRAGVRDWQPALDYIAAHPEVRDVLVSGGDPLTLADSVLERLLSGLRAIEHVEVIRLGTRIPGVLPMRVTPELVGMLKKYHPLWVNIHFNHPAEITPEAEQAIGCLADAGIALGSQSVLLAGINDCPNVIKMLGQKLVRNRVRPYYLYQCDLVEGAGHFRTPVAKGIEIMEALRGHTSGFAIPQYVIDAPGGGGKIPILPTYMISQSDTHVVVRNYEGMISTYAQPESYAKHDVSRCEYCNGRSGVAALLDGRRTAIKPEGWQRSHAKH